jgi:hypothetical protein
VTPTEEDAAIRDLVVFQRRLIDPAHPCRGQHANGHGTVRAEFTVRADLPAELRVGVFREPKTFAAWVRFSNGFSPDDRRPDVHGAAIKLLDLPGGEQDFLLADHPVFFATDVRRTVDVFKKHVELLAAGLSPADHDRQLAAAFPVEAVLLGQFVRPPDRSPLETQYWSVTPFALGDAAVKYLLRPRTENRSPGGPPPDSPDFLRAAMSDHLRTAPAMFDFLVQPRCETDPIEDPTVEWQGAAIAAAQLTILPQDFDTPDRAALEDSLAFSPWHALPEHRPLGGINRGRKPVYEMSWTLRRPPAAGAP